MKKGFANVTLEDCIGDNLQGTAETHATVGTEALRFSYHFFYRKKGDVAVVAGTFNGGSTQCSLDDDDFDQYAAEAAHDAVRMMEKHLLDKYPAIQYIVFNHDLTIGRYVAWTVHSASRPFNSGCSK